MCERAYVTQWRGEKTDRSQSHGEAGGAGDTERVGTPSLRGRNSLASAVSKDCVAVGQDCLLPFWCSSFLFWRRREDKKAVHVEPPSSGVRLSADG